MKKQFLVEQIVTVLKQEEVGQRLKGGHVVEVLNHLVRLRGAPKYLFADNGAKFTETAG